MEITCVVVYRPRCRRAGTARAMWKLRPELVADQSVDLDGFLRIAAVRSLCQLKCPICKKPLGEQMESDDPDAYRLEELHNFIPRQNEHLYRLVATVIPSGRLLLVGGR